VAVKNLDAEIAAREQRAGDAIADEQIVGFYESRSQFLGRISDLVAALDASARALAARPGDPAAHLARARALSGAHELPAALSELDAASRLGAPSAEVTSSHAAVLLAMGRGDEAAALAGHPAAGAQVSDWVAAAQIAAHTGNEMAGDAFFEAARSSYHDVSPFTVAWVDFERARSLEQRGDRGAAKAYLAEAARLLPCYSHAVVHLAALEPPESALGNLARLESTSDDPEVFAAKADALRRAGRRREAAEAAAQARARFEEVISALPKAFLDHAATFYLGMGGDPARALVLARANAEYRPTSEAAELWLTAAMVAGSPEEQCAAAHTRVAHPSARLKELGETLRGCP